MFWIILILIIVTTIIALFIFPELGNLALDLGKRLLKWDGILLIITIIFIVFFMYAKHKQLENKQLELQAVLKQEELKHERQTNLQKPKESFTEQSQEMRKQETFNQEQSKTSPAPISKQKETEGLQNLVKNWLNSWEEGNFMTYRTFYASDFQAGGKNLDAWVSHKMDMRKKSKNIKISIDEMQITINDNNATAVFVQHYSSSINKDTIKKTLHFKKENNEWKIYKEII